MWHLRICWHAEQVDVTHGGKSSHAPYGMSECGRALKQLLITQRTHGGGNQSAREVGMTRNPSRLSSTQIAAVFAAVAMLVFASDGSAHGYGPYYGGYFHPGYRAYPAPVPYNAYPRYGYSRRNYNDRAGYGYSLYYRGPYGYGYGH
jgi:hypothetical protein